LEWKKLFLSSFGIIFLSELGDKTQVTTLLLASEKPLYLLYVALGSAMALITASFIEVIIGSTFIAKYLRGRKIRLLSGWVFSVIGFLLIFKLI
jgi:putative Ca2+/H+ antiporter (TMEM165/GDT1 family)